MRSLLIAFVLTFVVACDSGKVIGTSSVTGTYTLRTINGSSLPYTLPGGGTTIMVPADQVYRLRLEMADLAGPPPPEEPKPEPLKAEPAAETELEIER